MAFNEDLASRIREALAAFTEAEEKYMFGGVCFMVKNKMCMGVVKDDMMCRVEPGIVDKLLEMPGCRPMDFTGKPMKGYVYVSAEGMRTRRDLDKWVSLCLDFNRSIADAKPKKKKKR